MNSGRVAHRTETYDPICFFVRRRRRSVLGGSILEEMHLKLSHYK